MKRVLKKRCRYRGTADLHCLRAGVTVRRRHSRGWLAVHARAAWCRRGTVPLTRDAFGLSAWRLACVRRVVSSTGS